MNTTTFTRKLGLGLAGMSVAMMSFAYSTGVAQATTSTTQIAIPVSTVVRNVGVGNQKVLEIREVADENKNMICSVKAVAENQGSVHPGNNLIVESGNSSVTLADVERAGGVLTETNGELKLGNVVTVSLEMGEDNVFSAGMTVKLTCEHEEKIEVCRDGEIITITEDQKLATDTDTCEQIMVCRDGELITITEDQKLATDTEKCEDVTVCRDGEVITITEDAVLETDTEGECPQTLGTQTELPNTGAGAVMTSAIAVATVASAGYGAIKSRR